MKRLDGLLASFAPPRFADAERSRVARLLNTLILSTLSVLIVAITARIGTIGLVGHWQIYPILIGLLAVMHVALRRGYIYSSGLALAATILVYGAVGAWGSGGLHSPTLQTLAIIILIGGLLGRTTLVLGSTAASLVVLCVLASVQFGGLLPEATQTLTAGSIFSGQVTVLLIFGGTMTLIVGTLQDARALAEAKEQALRESMCALEASQAELLRHRDELERRVGERTAELASSNEELRGTLESLERAQDQVAESEKMASLGLLVAGIAHEIKNPLNFVNNFSELALEFIAEHRSEHPEARPSASPAESVLYEVESNLQRIHEHGVRADRIINSMLMHAREGHGEATEVDVNRLIHEQTELAFHGFCSRFRGFKVDLVESLDPEAGTLMLPAQEFSGLIVNLVTNACQSMHTRHTRHSRESPAYRAKLEISTRRAGGAMLLTVRDNGIGIQPDQRRRVFDPFFTTKAPGEGTGLGLSLAYGLVVTDLHGSIEVSSEPAEGAEFVVRLPLADGEPGSDEIAL